MILRINFIGQCRGKIIDRICIYGAGSDTINRNYPIFTICRIAGDLKGGQGPLQSGDRIHLSLIRSSADYSAAEADVGIVKEHLERAGRYRIEANTSIAENIYDGFSLIT